MSEEVFPSFDLTVRTLWTPGAEVFFGSVAESLVRYPDFGPVRFGPKDPPRTKVKDLVEQFREQGRKQDGYQARLLYELPCGDSYGHVTYQRDPFAVRPRSAVQPSSVEIGCGDGDPLVFIELMVDLVERLDPWYAWVDHPIFRHQRNRFGTAKGDRWGLSPAVGEPPRWQRPPYDSYEMYVSDVFWVQFFGPGFVAKWGEDRFRGAGARRLKTKSGGYVVWATEDPPSFDLEADAPEAYAWKAGLYEAFGADPFYRLDRGWSDFGVHVPLMDEHRDCLMSAQSDS